MRGILGGGILAVALSAQAVARSFPRLVERLYSQGLYPRSGGLLGRTAGVLPFSLAECLVVGAVVVVAAAAGHTMVKVARGHGAALAALATWAANAALTAGIGYGLFLLLWGFNYARPPLAALAGLPVAPSPQTELTELARDLISRSNREREGLAEDAAGVLRIDGGFAQVARRVALGYSVASLSLPLLAGPSARPKPALLSPLLSRVGVTGIYFPFTGEPNVNTTVPDSELPFSAAHEVAHQRGFAREDEANYVAYLACRLHPDAPFRYSGFLAASHYALAALQVGNRPAARQLQAGRSEAVLRDEAAIRAWIHKYRGPATEVGRRVNDAYLKAQGQAEGVRSYGRMVDLLLAERRRGESKAAR